jgi:hypothetical protein
MDYVEPAYIFLFYKPSDTSMGKTPLNGIEIISQEIILSSQLL